MEKLCRFNSKNHRFIVVAVLFVVCFSTGHLAFAKEKEKTVSRKRPTVHIMTDLLEEAIALKKYFVSEENFLDPNHTLAISNHLNNFTKYAKEAHHNPQLKSENYRFSSDVLIDHIETTERVFSQGNKKFARWQFNATVAICASCHTQLPGSNRHFGRFGDSKTYASKFDQAEFLYSTRAFEEALDIYNTIIDKYKKVDTNIDEVETAILREMAYYVRVRRDLNKAQEGLLSHLKNSNLPENLRNDLQLWSNQLDQLKKIKVPDPQKDSGEAVVQFAENNLKAGVDRKLTQDHPNSLSYLFVSSILYEYLAFNPKSKTTPEILYLLAASDRALNNNFFFSLADMYLKECILHYPESAIAEKCFEDYKLEMIAGFSGSGGTFLPPEVSKELYSLRKLIDSKKKKKK